MPFSDQLHTVLTPYEVGLKPSEKSKKGNMSWIQYRRVWWSHIESKQVPGFFMEEWKAEQGTCPYEEYLRFNRRENIGIVFLLLGFFTCLVSGVVWILNFFDPLLSPAQFRIVTIILIAGLSLINVWAVIDPDTVKKRFHHKEFIALLNDLFGGFGILPSKEVGALSKEEVKTAIHESLCASAAELDKKTGFEKINAFAHWKKKHRVAVVFKLAQPSYTSYFPKK